MKRFSEQDQFWARDQHLRTYADKAKKRQQVRFPGKLLERFTHLLWTWPSLRAKSGGFDSRRDPSLYRELVPTFHTKTLECFTNGFPENLRKRGNDQEELLDNFDVFDVRRTRLEVWLKQQHQAGRDPEALCQLLGVLKCFVIWELTGKRVRGSEVERFASLQQLLHSEQKASLKRMELMTTDEALWSSEIKKQEETVSQLQEISDQLSWRGCGVGATRKEWGRKADQMLAESGVPREARREVLEIVGISAPQAPRVKK